MSAVNPPRQLSRGHAVAFASIGFQKAAPHSQCREYGVGLALFQRLLHQGFDLHDVADNGCFAAFGK
jgi:hypothetical protein